MFAVETHNLIYHYGRDQRVLDRVSLQVPCGAIYGFLGPNGAGKTTTLRLILGLLHAKPGAISLFGEAFDGSQRGLLGQVGSLIESPSLYSHLTARENLQLLQWVYPCPAERIDTVLALVGLSHAAHKLTGRFSLGMKQRLSLAIALLHDPKLLILDEPTNGLDPNGIIEMRALLRRLNRELGITILVSSHLLSEVERLVDHIGVIHQGRLQFQGTIEALRRERPAITHLTTNVPDRAAELLTGAGIAFERQGAQLALLSTDQSHIAHANRVLVAGGVSVFGIHSKQDDLESIFFQLIGAPIAQEERSA
jgi:lantibiotic transport system ATP-binding protein